MSFINRKNSTEGDDHRSHSSFYGYGNADQHEEQQSTRSELPAEIPDSQPETYLPAEIPDSQPETYLPAEIPDSQPDLVYHTVHFGGRDYSELVSQLPTRDQGDLDTGDAQVFDLSDYDLEEQSIDPTDLKSLNKENVDPRASRFDGFGRERVDDSVHGEDSNNSSSRDTEITPGGTRLTKRLKNRIPLHDKGIGCNGRLPAEAPQYRDFNIMDEQCTLPATQPVPRKENYTSMLSEQEESDIICILLPTSPSAHEAVELTARAAPQHILQNHGLSHIYEAPEEEMTANTRPGDDSDDVGELNSPLPDLNQQVWDGSAKDIALRFSSKVHNLGLGFTFGRNPLKCDLLLSNNKSTMISNRHFRIYMKNNGVLMIEDTSTNGTLIDDIVLRRGEKGNFLVPKSESQHTLCNGDTIELPLGGKQRGQSIRFSVKTPSRSEPGLVKYTQNCFVYIKCVEQAERQHGFLAEATKNGNAPLVRPVPMHALPQGVRPGTSAQPNTLLTAATGGNGTGMHWSGGPKYNVVGLIGSGAFASVYKLSSKRDGVVFAAKQLDKSRLAKDGTLSSKMYNELNLIKDLRHPNIVKYVDHHEMAKWLYIVMEYVRFGDLGTWTRVGTPMPEYMCMHVARQMLQAIDYLHQRGITHRDLKPDNVLMEGDCPYVFKLSDFGLSKIITNKDTFLKTFCGTMMYCAPEVYPGYQRVKASVPSKRSRTNAKYDHTFPYQHSVDIWGLGAVLYHLLSGEPPFTARHDPSGEDMLWNVLHLPVNWERLRMVGVSQLGVDFLSRMLVTEASERASDEELLDHPWIQVADGPADASDCVLSDPAERLNARASQLSIGEEGVNRSEGAARSATEDPRASKRARSWVPDKTRNVWGETASMVVRNQQRENWTDEAQLDMEFEPPPLSGENMGNQQQPNRLFGEIGTSALASSGALGLQGNRALQVHGSVPGSYDVSSDALYDDSRAGSPDGANAANGPKIHTEDANKATTQDPVQNQQRLPGPTTSGGAPSLLGTEVLVGQLNMASIGSGASAQAEKVKPATQELPRGVDSHKRSSQDMLPHETEGASKRVKTISLEHTTSGQLPNLSIADLRQKSMSPTSRPGSRDSNPGGYQEGQLSRGLYKSNYDLLTTAFNSRESSQQHGAGDDVIMGDDRDSDDEVSRLEEALAAAKAKKAAKAASRTNSGTISRASSRPTSSHGDPASTTHQPVTGSAVFDATAHHAQPATASFVKPPLRFGKLQPTRGSIHTPAIYITERLTTYGRRPDSTFVHPDPREDRIPKQALDIQMWYPGIEADIDAGKTNWMDHPKLEAILRTRASRYILVNGVKLRKGQGEYLWGRLRTGDEITVVESKTGATSGSDKDFLRFRCEFFVGLSKNIRKPGEKAFVVEVEKDKFKVAEERKSRESTAALGASKGNDGPTKEKGKGGETIDRAADNPAGKS